MWRQTTRDIAVEGRSLTQAHIAECKIDRKEARDRFETLQKDFNEKHLINQKNRMEDQKEFERFQKRLLIFIVLVLASIVLKGTKLDLLSQFLSGI